MASHWCPGSGFSEPRGLNTGGEIKDRELRTLGLLTPSRGQADLGFLVLSSSAHLFLNHPFQGAWDFSEAPAGVLILGKVPRSLAHNRTLHPCGWYVWLRLLDKGYLPQWSMEPPDPHSIPRWNFQGSMVLQNVLTDSERALPLALEWVARVNWALKWQTPICLALRLGWGRGCYQILR